MVKWEGFNTNQSFVELENVLKEKVYGQHLVQDVVVNALKSHWNGNHAQKPLTMSFHGWPGGGKNYVSRFIQESLYKHGSESSHVHHFMGRIHFPSDVHVNEYKVGDLCSNNLIPSFNSILPLTFRETFMNG